MRSLFDFLLHIDTHLQSLIRQQGAASYAILFAFVFAETGFVVLPFLPGDSLIFATGALLAKGVTLSLPLVFLVFAVAAVVGDSVNFEIGKRVGRKIFSKNIGFLNEKNLEKTEKFFEKHGGKTILIARFVPLIRTFAPFVAGSGQMHYGEFIRYNVGGGLLWVSLFLFGGYFFGNLPFVKTHFSIVVLVIVLISLLPAVYEFIKARQEK